MTTAVSFCTGTGALEMAARQALRMDFKLQYYSDIKPGAIKLMSYHEPDVPNLGDMKLIDYAGIGPIDIALGSWPCQPHSAAGLRLGEKDPRDLWPEYIRALTALRPAIYFGENVARVASNGELRRVVRSLADIGYVGAWRCVKASDIGACHQRDRLFIVAIDPAQLPTTADSYGKDVRNESGRGGGTHGQGPGVSDHDGQQGQVLTAGGLKLLPTPTERMNTGPGLANRQGGPNLQTLVTRYLPTPTERDRKGRAVRGERNDGSARTELQMDLTSAIMDVDWKEFEPAIRRHENILGRPAPAPTKISPRTGRPHLNPAFTEWMMMLPEGHVTNVPGVSWTAQLSLLGDGVVVNQAAYAFSSLLDHLL